MPGRTVSHYRILQKIGAGGMGEVFLAEDTQLERRVALKFLPAQLNADEDERQRFVHEAKAAAALSHPNIVTVYEIGDHEGQIFIAMEYVDGHTLKELISFDRPPSTVHRLPISQVLDIAAQIASGLSAAHEKGIVHRDLKPANVMVTAQGVVKIVDFGLAKLRGLSRLTKSGTTLGTVAYMSPEQALGKEVDQRSDIWSLGVILYEMLAGRLPFRGDYDQSMLYAIINEEPPIMASAGGQMFPDLEKVVRKALNKIPEQRYPAIADLIVALDKCRRQIQAPGNDGTGSISRFLKNPRFIVPATIAVLTLSYFGINFFKHQAKRRWIEAKILPRLFTLVESGRESFPEAFQLASDAEKHLPGDERISEAFGKISLRIDIRSTPPGADVFMRDYRKTEGEWKHCGITPIEGIRLPLGFFKVSMAKKGYKTIRSCASNFEYDLKGSQVYTPSHIFKTLDKDGEIPARMVRVTGNSQMEDFFFDQYEVTNKEFKAFLVNGGYQKRGFWKEEFIKDGKRLSWPEAIGEFVDQTGIPGPAGWQSGTYPDGEDDFPVTGVSWYEAAAYAEYAEKTLPTLAHWEMAAGGFSTLANMGFFSLLASQSNYDGQGPAPVGRYPGVTTCGAYDMAGNAREWCRNDSPQGKIIRGGAWNDATYLFQDLSQASPFDRSPRNGFRCAIYLHPDIIPVSAFEPVQLTKPPDLEKIKPVADSVFRAYLTQFSYDKTDLDARVEWRHESIGDWILEKLTFKAAYEKERIIAYLFLPTNSQPPFQTVIYFPGSGCLEQGSSANLEDYWEFRDRLSFLPASGRAILFPVYKGTFERRDPSLVSAAIDSHRHVEWIIKLVKDFRRCIDYLESRPDIDHERIAYFGFSWGGVMGAIIPAVEDRLRASILAVGGLEGFSALPEVNMINYIGRVKLPTLMLNGKYDLILPFEISVRPMFERLGTPREKKFIRLFNTDHFIPKNQYVKEILAWLDKYLDPVKR